MTKFKINKLDVRPVNRTDRQDRNRQTTRLYVSIQDDEREKPVNDILTGFRWNKPFLLYRQHVVPAVLLAMGQPEGTKVRWSQTAGCGCGCSPGFVIHQMGAPKDVWATVEAYEESPELPLTK